MAYPTNPTLSYSYTAWQTSQGSNSFPGTFLDDDLVGLRDAITNLNTFIRGALRSDGKLANASVGKAQLSPEITIGLQPPTVWATSRDYALNATVSRGSGLYLALVAHRSGTFSADLAAGKWVLLVDFSAGLTLPDGSVVSATIFDAAVTTAKVADDAITTAKVADDAIVAAKLGADVGAVPIGGSVDYYGPVLPPGWLWCHGGRVSRTTYAALFNALTVTRTVALNSSNTISGSFADLVNIGLVGVSVEGFGISSSTIVSSITATTITLSAPATATTASTQIRFVPYGVGDGVTTFSLPDLRGRVTVCRDDMGGGAASRVSTSLQNAGARLGGWGGSEYYALQSGENAYHSHGANVDPHTHADAGHYHSIANSYATAAGPNGSGGALQFNGPANYGGTVTLATGTGAGYASLNATTVGITILPQGSGAPHLNMQPSYVCNKIIFAGV